MNTYFVSRHAGAKEWASRRGIAAIVVEQLDLTMLRPGDMVLGTLPMHLAAAVQRRGCRFQYLEMETPRDSRGSEWSADDMERFGARLVEYEVFRLGRSEADIAARPAASRAGRGGGVFARAGSRLRALWNDIEDNEGPIAGLLLVAGILAIAPAAIGHLYGKLHDAGWPIAGVLAVCLLLTVAGYVFRFGARRPRLRLIRVSSRLPFLTPEILDRIGVAAPWAVSGGLVLLAVATLGAVAVTDSAVVLDALWFVAWYALFAGMIYVSLKIGRDIFGIETTQMLVQDQPPRPVVVLLLSALTEQSGGYTTLTRDETGRFSDNHLTASHLNAILDPASTLTLDRACAPEAFPGGRNFSWQQSFRVLASQFGPGDTRFQAGTVVVIPSHESRLQYGVFAEALQVLAQRSGLELTIIESDSADFFKLNDVEAAIRKAVRQLIGSGRTMSGRPVTYSDIIIDVTAGPKLASIAAASATFASDLMIAYADRQDVWILDTRARFKSLVSA